MVKSYSDNKNFIQIRIAYVTFFDFKCASKLHENNLVTFDLIEKTIEN
jgi:hypothetical protein